MNKFAPLPASEENLKLCFSLMDLTTLRSQDTPSSVEAFVENVNALPARFPDFPLPASICVYPNFAGLVRKLLKVSGVKVTAVAGCFPSSQSFLPVKTMESRLAVEAGADEIDIVLPLHAYLDGDKAGVTAEIRAQREAVGPKTVLEVILETGAMGEDAELMAGAARIALQSGADFLKTSTGKIPVGATPFAAEVLCRCIREHYQRTGKKVGFKAAGGISSAEDALLYLGIVNEILGPQWLTPRLLRLGVSRLGDSLLSAVKGSEVRYFG